MNIEMENGYFPEITSLKIMKADGTFMTRDESRISSVSMNFNTDRTEESANYDPEIGGFEINMVGRELVPGSFRITYPERKQERIKLYEEKEKLRNYYIKVVADGKQYHFYDVNELEGMDDRPYTFMHFEKWKKTLLNYAMSKLKEEGVTDSPSHIFYKKNVKNIFTFKY